MKQTCLALRQEVHTIIEPFEALNQSLLSALSILNNRFISISSLKYCDVSFSGSCLLFSIGNGFHFIITNVIPS